MNGPTLSQFTLHKSTSESPLFSQASFSLHADSKRVALCLGQGDDAQLNRSQLNRTAAGVRGIRFKADGDEVVSCITFDPEREAELSVLTITTKGQGKRTTLDQYRMQQHRPPHRRPHPPP